MKKTAKPRKSKKTETKANNCVRVYPSVKEKIEKNFGSVQNFLDLMIKSQIH